MYEHLLIVEGRRRRCQLAPFLETAVFLLVNRDHVLSVIQASTTPVFHCYFLDQQACGKKQGDGYGFNTDGL